MNEALFLFLQPFDLDRGAAQAIYEGMRTEHSQINEQTRIEIVDSEQIKRVDCVPETWFFPGGTRMSVDQLQLNRLIYVHTLRKIGVGFGDRSWSFLYRYLPVSDTVQMALHYSRQDHSPPSVFSANDLTYSAG